MLSDLYGKYMALFKAVLLVVPPSVVEISLATYLLIADLVYFFFFPLSSVSLFRMPTYYVAVKDKVKKYFKTFKFISSILKRMSQNILQ